MGKGNRSNNAQIASSMRLSGICAAVVAVVMFLLKRILFEKKEEATFLGGILGAILFLFLLIMVGNYKQRKNQNAHLNWLHVGLLELVALIYSYFIHPVCTTTCLLFSIPVVVYLKWAYYELSQQTKQK